MDWKKRLGEIKGTMPQQPQHKEKAPEKQEAAITHPVSEEVPSAAQPEIYYDDKTRLVKERQDAEYQEMLSIRVSPEFQRLIRELEITTDASRAHRFQERRLRDVMDVFFKAKRGNVTHNIDRFIRPYVKDISADSRQVIEHLRTEGYRAEAYKVWQAAQPEGMRYGTRSREERLKEAEEWAERAGVSLEEIIQERQKDKDSSEG